ncbi:MAG: trypsin-like peptidase domain-containing protein [Alphaproteobacteria bacterium]|nr:trypsin-like peptidase domain-containing protein [Alphaproteobacteria bacterium]
MTLTLLASLAAGAAQPEAPGPDQIASWLDAVVVVVTGPSLCAGALIDELGTVATAYHCVSSGRRPELETRDGVKVVGRILATDPKADLALVSAPELAGRSWLLVREEAPRPGEAVWALGHPFGTETERSEVFEGLLRWSVTRGIVSAVGER